MREGFRSVATAVLLVVLVMVVAACGGEEILAGMVRQPPPNVSSVVLPDVANGGSDFATQSNPGEILVLYFGYTSCPDICPTTLADLRRALESMGDESDQVSFAMVTVDPVRDTPEHLVAYVSSFFEDAHALRTDDWPTLEAAARAFGASYEIKQTAAGDIEVAHSAFLYAIDSSGQIQVQWPFGMTSEDIASDLQSLLKRST